MMKKLNNIKFLILILLLGCPLTAMATPQSMDLDFAKLNTTGDMKVVVKFNEATDKKCKAYARIKLYHEDQQVTNSQVISGTVIRKTVKRGKKKVTFTAKDLPGAKKSGGKDPIMSMQAWLKCGDENVFSDVEARYIICGEGKKRVSLIRYFTAMEDNIR